MSKKQSEIAVVYYSLSGNTRHIAQSLASAIGADLVELLPEKARPEKGFLRFFLGGMRTLFKSKPKLKPFAADLSAYRMLVLGSPVWAGTFAPPLRTFITRILPELGPKELAFFSCHGGPSPGKSLKAMSKYSGQLPVSSTSFQEPLSKEPDKAAEQARKWGKTLLSSGHV